ncbi:MAG: hypothetical protein ACK5GN_07215 [Pseudomonadota bacterium]|jgi:hypothetical protein
MKHDRSTGERRSRGVSLWLIALVLVVVGVLLARLVRAVLLPVLRPAPISFETHVV